MKFTYSLMVIDEDGEVVVDHELEVEQAVKILADALVAAKSLPKTLTIHDKEDEPVAGKKPRKCGACGEKGHTSRTCPGIRK